MATAAQVLANRANAQSSTGPRSAEGKSVASKNATRHGLSSAAFTLLPNEDPAEFEQLLASLRDEFQPEGEHESFLIDQAAKSRWKLIRIERLESEAFEQLLTDPASGNDSPDALILKTLSSSGNILDKLQRYATAAERAYSKAIRELQQHRSQQLRNTHKAADAWIKQYIFAPTPPQVKNYQTTGALPEHPSRAPRQNEPKSDPKTNAYGLGNPALRL